MWSKYTIYTDIIEYETPFYLYHSFFHKFDRWVIEVILQQQC